MTGNQVISAVEHATAVMHYFHQQRESQEFGFTRDGLNEDEFQRVVETFGHVARVLLPGGPPCVCCNGTGTAGTVRRHP
jgi:hypothetical protein